MTTTNKPGSVGLCKGVWLTENINNLLHKNLSGHETANVNFYSDDIVHVQASAYAHSTEKFPNFDYQYLC